MSYLYITENGATLNIDGGYFVVTYKNGLIRKIPKETLESVAIFANVSITTPCIEQFLTKGIPVNYFSQNGAYYGRLESTAHKNIKRLKKQIFLSESPEFSLNLSKRIINAKINNQLVILRRYNRNLDTNFSNEFQNIKYLKSKIENCSTSQELIGYEGTVAKIYFSIISKIINPNFSFSGRNRMPPKDPFNSLLSLGYTLLLHEIYGEIESKGLSPYCGFLHKDHERHPTLASDLMEEWRSIIVDSVVLSLIQGNEISKDDFIRDEETKGIFLNKTAMKTFINKYEDKLRSENNYLGERMSVRRCLWHQVNSLTNAIEYNNITLYTPIYIR